MENEKLVRPGSHHFMPLIAFAFVFGVGSLQMPFSMPRASAAAFTEKDAREFCLQVWFPRLVLGKPSKPEQIEKHFDHLMEVYSKNIQISDPNNQDLYGKPLIQGRAEVRKYYEAVLTRYPEWKFEILAIHPTEKGFVLHYRGSNAPPVTSFDGVDILQIDQGNGKTANWKITRLDGFYDRHPFFEEDKKEANR